MFGVSCDEISSEHKQLHCEVLWFLRGKVLYKLFLLCDKFRIFSFENDRDDKSISLCIECVCDENGLKCLIHFHSTQLDELNNAKKEHQKSFIYNTKLMQWLKKLKWWACKVEEYSFSVFNFLHDFVELTKLWKSALRHWHLARGNFSANYK